MEAAAYRGRPVYFGIVGPWTRPTRMQPPPQARVDAVLNTIASVIMVTVFLGAMLLARHHLRSNRADRRGAARLTAYVLIGGFVHWAVGNHHVASLTAEVASLVRTAGGDLATAAVIWVMYVALEPYVRRFWPDNLLGWSRLLAGHFRDPRVGRDLLAGMAFGMALSFVELAKARLLPLLGYGAPMPTYGREINALVVSGRWLTAAIEVSSLNLAVALLIVLLFVVLRLVLRRMPLAVAAGFVMLTAISGNAMSGTGTWLVVLFPIASGALLTFVVVRFGLLPLALALLVWRVVLAIPFTLDVSHWSATASNWTMAWLAALTLFGFYASRAGQPLFGKIGDVANGVSVFR